MIYIIILHYIIYYTSRHTNMCYVLFYHILIFFVFIILYVDFYYVHDCFYIKSPLMPPPLRQEFIVEL
jgi:hypothetical protein